MIINQPLYLGISITKGTRRILPYWKRFELRIQGMVNQKLTNQRLPFLQNEFDRLRCLNQSDLPGHNSQDTCFVSAGDQTWRRRFGKEATQTRPSLFGKEDTRLALELKNTTINIRLPCKKGDIVHQILRRKVV